MARRFTIDDWQQRLNHLNQPLLIIGKKSQNRKEIFTLQCYKCGGTFEANRRSLNSACIIRENNKNKSNWCPICNGKTVVSGINDIATLRSDLVKYFENIKDAESVSTGSHKRVKLKCPECKQSKIMYASDLCSCGFHCDYCSDSVSLGNKIIRNLMLQLPVDKYDFEYTDSWAKQKRYDCFFEYKNKKYLIEIDGEQHIKNTSWSTKEWQNQNDLLKSSLASNNGFILIRIKAYKTDFDYIKQSILKSELSTLFDLSNIDWNVINKQTITSMNLMIAEYYMKHKTMMLKDIAEYFHISYPTLRKILKNVTALGMCDFSDKEVRKNGRIQMVKNKAEKHAKFTVYSPTDENLGSYGSVADCYRTLEYLFKQIGLTRKKLDTYVFMGDSYNGYRFVYENGLYEYHKAIHPKLFEICEMFNYGMSVKEISLKMNCSTGVIYKNIIAGKNIGICNYAKRKERKVV